MIVERVTLRYVRIRWWIAYSVKMDENAVTIRVGRHAHLLQRTVVKEYSLCNALGVETCGDYCGDCLV